MPNPNPSPETRIGQPRGPQPGKTSEHRQAEIRAAELAAKVQLELVEALHNVLVKADGDEVKISAIKADVLKLIKDAQDRAFGVPKAAIDLSSEDGTMAPPQIVRIEAVAGQNGDG